MGERRLACAFFEFQSVTISIGIRFTQDNFYCITAMATHRINLDWWGGGRHDNHSFATKRLALKATPGRDFCGSANHAALNLGWCKVGDFVVEGTTQFKTKYALHVFTFEVNVIVHTFGQSRCKF